MIKRIGLALCATAVAACGGNATSPTAVTENLELRMQTAHFRVLAGSTPDAAVRAAADRLEAEYPRILAELNVSSHPLVTVRIWQDENTYFNELTRYFGTRFQSSGYVTGPTELRVLAVAALNVNVVHEFVHAVTLGINSRFGNNPRWFWESVALYENGELVDPRTIDYIVRGNFPTLQQLSVDVTAGTQVYQLGYLLGDFIVTRFGRPAFLRLIDTNADLRGVLGMSEGEFEAAFQAYVRQRYFS